MLCSKIKNKGIPYLFSMPVRFQSREHRPNTLCCFIHIPGRKVVETPHKKKNELIKGWKRAIKTAQVWSEG
jgi:hypothetical protein